MMTHAGQVACATMLLVACGNREAPRPDGATGIAPGAAASPAATRADQVFGKWTVTGHRLPGVSAMSDADASQWHGKVIEFTPASAVAGADACETPTYETVTLPADSLLNVDYRVGPASLGLAPGSTIEVTTVDCSGSQWSAPGGRLLHVGPNRAFTVWDGVFLELQRN